MALRQVLTKCEQNIPAVPDVMKGAKNRREFQMEFEQYYKSFGLEEYPFGVFTTEAEVRKSFSLFLKPENHSVILEGLKNTSAIVIGERGTGKTDLSLDSIRALEATDSLIVRIEEFSSLPQNYSTEDLYNFLVERIAARFFDQSIATPNRFWCYSKDERIDLSMYLHRYLSQSTKHQLRDKIGRIQNGLIKRWSIGAYNSFRVALNYGLKAATKVISDALTKHFSSLPDIDIGNSDYFKRIEAEIDDAFTGEEKQYFYLEKLCRLIQKGGFNKIYIVIDKIDEDPRFQNDAESISEFIKPIGADNKILTTDLFHILLFFWSTPFNYIKDSVRTQKLSFQELGWTHQALEKVLQKRLETFSNNKITHYSELFDNVQASSVDLIFEMCNHNPRDLWHIFNSCFTEQFAIDSSRRIGDDAVRVGIEKFVTNFNYYEYYPKKSNARSNSMDVYAYIKHLLKLDSSTFTKDRLSTTAGTGSSTTNYVVGMENMGLVRKTMEKGQGGAVIYEIRDPKVRYAMTHKIPIEA
jgi:Cdc6-like AAA superfamily ATPase